MRSGLHDVLERGRAPRFVGRGDELSVLDAEFARVVAGSFRVILIGGAAGVGKTRLATEAVARWSAEATSLSARCYRWSDTASFEPWVEALDRHLRGRSEAQLRHLAGGSLNDLSVLLRPFAALTSPGPGEPRRADLLEGLVDLLARLSEERPLLVALDDMHLADASSWEALRYLGRRLPGSRIGIVVTARPTELRRHPIAVEVLLGLGEDGSLRRMSLRPLGRADVTQLVRDVLGSDPGGGSRVVPDALVSWLLHRSLGHPLFVVSLLTALMDEGADLAAPRLERLPGDLHDRVALEVEALDEADRGILELLAVIERPTSLDGLVAATGWPTARLGGPVAALATAGLLREHGSPGAVRYEITHPIVQDAIYERMGGARRRTLHRAVAQTLAEEGELGAAAAHFARSAAPGDPEAVEALLRAMRQAEERGLYQQALAILAGLLDVLPAGDERWLQVLDVMDWPSEWMIGHLAEGDADVAIAAMERIGPLVEAGGDPAAQGTLDLHLAAFLSIGTGRLEEAARAGQRAIVRFREAGAREGAFLARNELAWIEGCAGDLERQAEIAGEVLVDADASGRVRAAMHAAGTLGYALVRLGRIPEAREALSRGVELARAAGDRYRTAWGRNHLGVLDGLTGHPARGRGTIRSALDEGPMAPDAGTFEYLAHVEWLTGDLASCVGQVERSEARRSMRGSRRRAWSLALASRAYAEMAQHQRARRRWQQATATYEDQQILDWAWWCDWAEGTLAWHNGEHRRALEALDRAYRWLRGLGAITYEVLPLLDAAEVAADVGDTERAEEAAGRMAEIADVIGGAFHRALADLGAAHAHMVAGRTDAAVRDARDAAGRLSGSGYRLYAAIASDVHGRSVLAGDRRSGLRTLRDAAAALDDRGASWRRDRVLSLLNQLGTRGRRAATGILGPQALTAREREVVQLAVQGYTARETGERLFISQRTVETHLQNAYAKLGVSSKRELTRRADELGFR